MLGFAISWLPILAVRVPEVPRVILLLTFVILVLSIFSSKAILFHKLIIIRAAIYISIVIKTPVGPLVHALRLVDSRSVHIDYVSVALHALEPLQLLYLLLLATEALIRI